MDGDVELRWVSERHLRVRVGSDTSVATHRRVRGVYEAMKRAGVGGVRDLIPAYATVLVEFEMAGLDEGAAEEAVREVVRGARVEEAALGRLVEIPVWYGGEFGPDIEEVARVHGMTGQEVAAVHSGVEYLVHFVGFVPGFAYMGGLPAGLATPRLEKPRVRVPAGSVGIAGEQTGVYPFATPGGWRLIGRTPVRMFDAGGERASMLEMGDRVRFVGIEEGEFREMSVGSVWGEVDVLRKSGAAGLAPSRLPPAAGGVRVVEPGMMTTVQDLGRPGLGALGVCAGGAADPASLRVGNRLVGNEDGAAGLEVTLLGCVLEFEAAAAVVVVGAGARVGAEGRDVGGCEVVHVRRGDRLSVKRPDGARAYVFVGGGIDVPRVMGSRSTHLSAGFGGMMGRAVRAGDMLPIGSSVQDAMNDHSAGIVGEASRRRMVRIVMNESGEFADPGAFLGAEYKVSSQSDRAGLRLEGPRVASLSAGRMISEEMMWGAVQIPEDGRPIVLNVDYPVTGGYPVIGCVAAVDQPVLGQLRPGDAMRFEAVTREQARQLFRDRS